MNVREVAHELEDLFYRQPFRIPAQFAFAGRAVGTLSGLATGLAPEFNLVSVAVPYAQTFLGLNREGANQAAQQVLTQLLDASRTMLTLPSTLDRVIRKVEAGELQVHIAENGRNGFVRGARGQRYSARSATSGGLQAVVVCIAALAAGVALTLNEVTTAGWFCFGIAAV